LHFIANKTALNEIDEAAKLNNNKSGWYGDVHRYEEMRTKTKAMGEPKWLKTRNELEWKRRIKAKYPRAQKARFEHRRPAGRGAFET